jgi:hypothetical protein
VAADPERALLVLAAATFLAGLSVVQSDRSQPARPELAIGCLAPCTSERESVPRPGPHVSALPAPEARRAVPITVGPKATHKPVARPAPAPKPTTRAKPKAPAASARHRVQLKRAAATADPATAAAISRMRLTPAGYRAFLDAIDQSAFDYAQQFIEFDPARVPIEQGRSQVFVWHFTTFYRNADGPAAAPAGDMAVRPFVQGLAERGDEDNPPDHVCCGVNWVVDRHGPAHQLAPVNAKLRHNPPYDSINTGVEVEAARQVDITTDQYESLAYLTITVLQNQDLLGRRPLSEIAKGHGEMRDAFLAAHPESHYDNRDDFNAPESRLLRQAIERFLKAHPGVPGMVPRLR